jgi:NAD(P)H-dependent FMN reductase
MEQTKEGAGLITNVAGNCQVLLISGSLRRQSTNAAVLRTAQAVAPDHIVTILYDGLAALPHFNPDDDIVPLHPAVTELRIQIRTADAVLVSAPEYAGALPGSFKNLLDWSIGDDHVGSIYEKPIAWINTSPRGATDAYESLRKVLGYAHATIVEEACLQIPVKTSMVDDNHLIADLSIRDSIAEALKELATHIDHVG